MTFFSVPREQVADVTDCRDNNTGLFPNNGDQGSSTAGNIHRPELQKDLFLKIANEKLQASENVWDIPFLYLSYEKY